MTVLTQEWSVSKCRESRVESKMSRFEGMSRVEGNLKNVLK